MNRHDSSRRDTTTPDKRAGDADRDRYAALVREAHAKGYLKTDEVGERIDRVMSAVTMSDLSRQAADLPSMAALTGKEKTPGKVRRLLTGIDWSDARGSWWAYTALLVAFLVLAIIPAIAIFSGLPGHPLGTVRPVLGAATIIAGVAGFVTVLFRWLTVSSF